MRRTVIRAIMAGLIACAVQAWALGAARAASLPFSLGPGQGVFLHLSDIHFDPFADPTLVPQLIAAPIEQWQAIFQSSSKTGVAQYGHDSNYPLLASMLSAAQGPAYDYVLNTGDNLSHGFEQAFQRAGGADKDYESFVLKTLQFVDRMLAQSFPGVPLISTLGNNDSACGDYMLAPNSAMLTALGRDLPVIARDPQALRDFAIGGFYVTPHPTVPKHDIVVLSDVFWSHSYRDNCDPSGGDPGAAELAWLEWTLYQEKLAGRSASLVMHIPPGIDAYSSSRGACPASIKSFWQDAYADLFLDLVAAYKDVLRGSYAGHTHMDDFRVVADASGTPILTTRIAPSVSPLFGNNPSFTVVLYDKEDAGIADYAAFYLSNLTKAGPAVAPEWPLEYAFGETYGNRTYTPAGMISLTQRLRSDATVRSSYMRYYAAQTTGQSPINANNWPAFTCAQTAITPDDYAACYCPGGAKPVPAPR